MPASFRPDDETVEYCQGIKCDGNFRKFGRVLAKFMNHHTSRGTLRLDWQAACREWFDHEAERDQGKIEQDAAFVERRARMSLEEGGKRRL